MNYRIEADNLGEKEIPQNAYYGIHTLRAKENFPFSQYKIPDRLIVALGLVKKAAIETNLELGFLETSSASAMIQACDEITSGNFRDQFILDPLQGGAGTSTNMCINEIIANRALEILGYEKGLYSVIHPIEQVNLHQSTNDVYPTALKIAAIFAFRDLSDIIAKLQGAFQQKEQEYADILTVGRTEWQDAVPMTLGAQFSAFAEAIARDRWRTFKCEERLRSVNIGGTAVGTGIAAPRKYIFSVIEKLRTLTGLGILRSENVLDATANLDCFTEVSGMLNANATNLIKIANDLRFLHYQNEINLPAMQAGSSIMPGKINPVAIEAVIQIGIKVQANDRIINDCVSRGSLQINEFIPLVAFALLESLELLKNSNHMFTEHIKGITANPEICNRHFRNNDIIITAFLPFIGYEKAQELLNEYKACDNVNFHDFLADKLGEKLCQKVLSSENLISLGYKI